MNEAIRRFEDDEIDRILRDAVVLQEARETTRRGLTLEELKAVGREAGIDPACVEEAATVERRGRALISLPPGAGVTVRLHRAVPFRFEETDSAVMINDIRALTGRRGRAVRLDRGVEWNHRDVAGTTVIAVRPRGGMTDVHVMGAYHEGAVLLHALGLGLVTATALLAGLLLAGLGPVAAVTGVAGVVFGGWIGIRSMWRTLSKRRADALGRLNDRVVHALAILSENHAPRSTGA